ncbi:Extradiol ring-cleavage dioxygenase class III enzyme subunit B [Penicillium vulpinum]|uniref:Extradiol ring-cleavage dioxygenase class III enzyme subunit B domain-containing protein n=1 Tax=Penicillium vulpinum TaxID=29845 RepID=A0A1V6RX88_9EURO|nr:Extradiol ring-cleavage dioxygenase class III enzyme subunit B [Penicillium vulpinum]KAJ5952959.1 Extradiol ring-cleavage dioxygenase class III enzyme subunit B [Penicillium vulpinum]OQE06377.1 hypothetical protein PENVUL_c018G02290 [Penicillium vulpinum]
MSSVSSQHNHSETRTPNSLSGRKLALISLVTVLAAVLITLLCGDTANLFGLRRLFGSSARSSAIPLSASASVAAAATVKGQSDADTSGQIQSTMKTPIYFFSHGGPNIMYDLDHPAYRKLGEIGREITTKVKPKAVVVFSAHWQAGRNTIQVNTAEKTDLIYDFGGFPSHYYKEKYPHVGSTELANEVLRLLKEAKISAEGVKRGLDHGVWVSFKCAFEPDSNPLNVPIVQVSLFGTEDPDQHYRLGQAVASLREQNIMIIVSGMAVHNLRDLRFAFGSSTPMPYAVSFDKALKDAVTTAPAERQKAMAELLKRSDARPAHPSFEHLLPIHIGAGAAGEDMGKRIWTLPEGSMSWAQYRFGEVGNSSSAL